MKIETAEFYDRSYIPGFKSDSRYTGYIAASFNSTRSPFVLQMVV